VGGSDVVVGPIAFLKGVASIILCETKCSFPKCRTKQEASVVVACV
jgi:hypothetical protein